MTQNLLAISQDQAQAFLDEQNIKLSDESIKRLSEYNNLTDYEGWKTTKIIKNTAIISIKGALTPYDDFFSWLTGSTSVDNITQDFDNAMSSPDIKNIIFQIDSPGGEITGISELSKKIYSAKNKKSIIAYVSGLAASGAYWIASATSTIIADATSELGSIGVILSFFDTEERDKQNGIKKRNIISSISPLKKIDSDTDQGKMVLQKRVDDLADVFVSAVAIHRNTTIEKVKNNYGKGNIMIAGEAIKVGMADRLGSLDMILEELNNAKKTSKITQRGVIMTDENVLTKE